MKVTTYRRHLGKWDKIEYEVVDSPDNFESIKAYLEGCEGMKIRTSAFLRNATKMGLTINQITDEEENV